MQVGNPLSAQDEHTPRPTWLRILQAVSVILILVCVAFLVSGGIAVLLKWLSKEFYLATATIVGGLASVMGLLSLSRTPRSTLLPGDLRQLELNSVRRLAESYDELSKLERTRSDKEKELGSLQDRKREMELLVKKASLTLYLREQQRLYRSRIIDELERDRDLSSALASLSDVEAKLATLNEEIEADPNIDLLREIMKAAETPKVPTAETQAQRPWAQSLLSSALSDLLDMMVRVLRV
ncbi:MAG TPA: hypothetical protein VFI02_21240 [Armatimonadota bacterium]|nr:hypothetical protein [Armatimonadota bacterium]